MSGSSLRQRLFPFSGTQNFQERSQALKADSTHLELGRDGRHLLSEAPGHGQQQRDEVVSPETMHSALGNHDTLNSFQRARQSDSQRSRLILGSRYLSPKADDSSDDAHPYPRPGSVMSMVPQTSLTLVSPRGFPGNQCSIPRESLPQAPQTTSNVSQSRPFSEKRPAKSLRQRLDPGAPHFGS
ncbi:hypothetical protein BD310DRAFT_459116 [Dichomitus squalens]|uniref:Uncharacterized protein n=1 Tax=Dichomitus squalens TaxID=114155 RepID=A0A4Q9QA66_9APHY|nr:hypothetical protein BD310DRAFT_459116 [Dichomitus squalens]